LPLFRSGWPALLLRRAADERSAILPQQALASIYTETYGQKQRRRVFVRFYGWLRDVATILPL
jgi:hypothetical protein